MPCCDCKNALCIWSVFDIGWQEAGYENLEGIKDYNKLPASLKESISDFEKFTGGYVKIVSTGAERDETIIR